MSRVAKLPTSIPDHAWFGIKKRNRDAIMEMQRMPKSNYINMSIGNKYRRFKFIYDKGFNIGFIFGITVSILTMVDCYLLIKIIENI